MMKNYFPLPAEQDWWKVVFQNDVYSQPPSPLGEVGIGR